MNDNNQTWHIVVDAAGYVLSCFAEDALALAQAHARKAEALRGEQYRVEHESRYKPAPGERWPSKRHFFPREGMGIRTSRHKPSSPREYRDPSNV